MTDQPLHNMGPNEQRKRLFGGIGLLVVAGIGYLFLLWYDVALLWRLLIFLPLWAGVLSILQYLEGT